MKKLIGLSLFWLLLIGFYYSPSPLPQVHAPETIDIQEVTPFPKVTYLKKPLSGPTP